MSGSRPGFGHRRNRMLACTLTALAIGGTVWWGS
jgi:hypothetical protein